MQRPISGIGVGLSIVLAAGSCNSIVFLCDVDTDCTQFADGVCQVGNGCAYPDSSCESDLRYSDYARDDAGECVPAGAGGTETEDAESSGEATATGPVPTDCDGVECSGRGACVMLEGDAHCLCDPGYYRVGVQCLEDPCDSTTCYFVDFDAGDDSNPGTRDEPWKSLSRVDEDTLGPGDTVLLRRGGTTSEQLTISGAQGSSAGHITFGAYGPIDDGPPAIDVVRVWDSSYLILRDISVPAPMSNNVVLVQRSDHVIVRDCLLRGPFMRGIRIDDRSSHIVLMQNRIEGGHDAYAFTVMDVNWNTDNDPLGTFVGDHHWIIDNVIDETPGAEAGGGIRILGRDVLDVKIVGNRVRGTGDDGIHDESGGASWLVGNTVAQCGSLENGGANIKVRKKDEASADDRETRISGNLAAGGDRALVLGTAGATVRHNTFTQDNALPLASFSSPRGLVFVDNLNASGSSELLDITAGALDDAIELDRNWYVPMPGGDCIVEDDGTEVPWSDWVSTSSFDESSVCADGPITATPTQLGSVDGWTDEFFDAFAPPPSWERCTNPAGAFDCDGNRLGTELEPIATLADNDGRGWEGPIEVRLRYRFAD